MAPQQALCLNDKPVSAHQHLPHPTAVYILMDTIMKTSIFTQDRAHLAWCQLWHWEDACLGALCACLEAEAQLDQPERVAKEALEG